MQYSITDEEVSSFRAKLSIGLANCRKAGLLARANFSCCGTCGHYELSEKLGEKDAKTHGYAFWHGQSEEGIEDGSVCIYFGGRETVKAQIAAGQIVADSMRSAGLLVFWPGDAGHAVQCYGKSVV